MIFFFGIARRIYEIILLHKKVWLPLFVDPPDKVSDESHMVRPAWYREELHPCLFRSPIPLLIVASHTRAYEILPCLLSAARPGDNMIHGQRKITAPAILAMVSIASQNILPGQYHPLVWNPIINRKSQDARHRHRSRHGSENPSVVTLYQFRFSKI